MARIAGIVENGYVTFLREGQPVLSIPHTGMDRHEIARFMIENTYDGAVEVTRTAGGRRLANIIGPSGKRRPVMAVA